MPDYQLPPYRVEATFTPQSIAEIIDWGLMLLHVPPHWKQTQGEGVRVALLDTGIDESHPDLAAAIDDARDFTGSRGGPADYNGHGTHVAGIVAARQNGRGVIGVAPRSRLLIGKVLGDDGGGSSAAVAAGVDWACDQNASIIGMSLGSPEPDPRLLAVIRRATAKGVFVIAAAGNAGRANSVNYPAQWRETVAVAAIDRIGRLSDFSSRGPQVDIAAPGHNVLSTYRNSGYARLSGTSMAAPFVAGVAALLVSLHNNCRSRLPSATAPSTTPLLTVNDLLEHLRRTALDAGPPGHDPGYGWGLINPDRLLAA
jgi:subtilisin family serine protease